MVVERQGEMECVLSTMGALSGRSLATIREIAADVATARGLPFFMNSVLDAIADAVDSTGHLRALLGLHVRLRIALSTGNGHAIRLSNLRRNLPSRGRGVVRFSFGSLSGHMAPWENGLIYDPADPGLGQTLTEYRRANRRMHVDYITQSNPETTRRPSCTDSQTRS